MKLYAQHGWGKGEKVNRGLTDRVIEGVVLSPHDETPDDIRSYATELSRRRARPDVFLDPQVYVSLIRNANEGKLPLYPYYRQNLGLRDLATVRTVQQIVRQCVDFQRGMEVTHILSPAICAESFTDRSEQVALMMAQETIDYLAGTTDKRPVLISIVFSELALTHGEQVSEFLDTISLLEAAGFYVVVDRNNPVYSQDFQSNRFAQMIRIVHSLKRSRFQVVCGYSDFVSLIYGALGADACGTGWSQKLRRFSRSRFQPAAGGRRPRERYSSTKLINSIYLSELDACQEVQRLDEVKSGTAYDGRFDGRSYPSGMSWSADDSVLNHWASLSLLTSTISGKNARDRLDHVLQAIANAQTLYGDLAQLGVTFEPPNGPGHLASWDEAISIFQSEVRI